jgi:hypothetical protein
MRYLNNHSQDVRGYRIDSAQKNFSCHTMVRFVSHNRQLKFISCEGVRVKLFRHSQLYCLRYVRRLLLLVETEAENLS